jgi:CRP/FNR family transcriptional regulator, cyclic AMP receptor protein
MAANLDLLRTIAIFQELAPEELGRISELCEERRYPAGAYVFREGEPGNRLFIIAEGEVRISRQIPGAGEEALAVLKPGALFGEMAVFDKSERSTDAIAHNAVTLLTISRPEFEMLLEFNRELGIKVLLAVIKMLNGRLRSTNDSLKTFLAMSMF